MEKMPAGPSNCAEFSSPDAEGVRHRRLAVGMGMSDIPAASFFSSSRTLVRTMRMFFVKRGVITDSLFEQRRCNTNNLSTE
jgi:hypothetical protein